MRHPLRKSLLISPIAALVASAGIAAAAPADAPRDPGPPAGSAFQRIQITAGHGRLGIAALEVSRELRAHLGAPSDRGVLVDAVRPDGAAARAGLQVGDVILELDGEPATSAIGMLEAIADRKQGDQVAIAALRDGRRVELTATLTDDPGPRLPRFRRLERDLERELDRPLREMLRGGLLGPSRRHLDELREQLERMERRLEQLERR